MNDYRHFRSEPLKEIKQRVGAVAVNLEGKLATGGWRGERGVIHNCLPSFCLDVEHLQFCCQSGLASSLGFVAFLSFYDPNSHSTTVCLFLLLIVLLFYCVLF